MRPSLVRFARSLASRASAGPSIATRGSPNTVSGRPALHLGRQHRCCWESPPAEASALTPGSVEHVIQEFAKQYRNAQDDQPNVEVKTEEDHENESLLAQFSVNNVLLACSLYDSYTFEEDGYLAELLFHEHAVLNLKKPPNIKRVSTEEEALERLKTGQYDMLISLFRLEGSGDIRHFLDSVDEIRPDLPVMLIALNPQELTRMDPRVEKMCLRFNFRPSTEMEFEKQGYWRRPFLWNGDVSLLVAMIKSVEDRMNMPMDIQCAPEDVKCIIVVEDSVYFYSSFLPTLYKEILKQTHLRAADVTDPQKRLSRIKKRPKVLLATNFEEATHLARKYKDNVLGIITDAGFPRNGEHDPMAGIKLANEVMEIAPGVPVLMQSSNLSIMKHAKALDLHWLHKDSPFILSDLRSFLNEHLGFGPFHFRFQAGGPIYATANDVGELADCIERIPPEVLMYHAKKNHFSLWLASRGYFKIAHTLRAIQMHIDADADHEEVIKCRKTLLAALKRGPNTTAVAEFDSTSVQWSSRIARIGTGSLGGKGRGFRFLNTVLEANNIEYLVPGARIIIPRSLVVAAGEFDRFIEENGLLRIAMDADSDGSVARLFLEAKLQSDLVEKLRHQLTTFKKPIAVRSSSIFEDAFQQPFAGVYSTYLLPNNHDDPEARLTDLCTAIKMVYASTFFAEAREYAKATGHRIEEEKMAVVIQEVTGTQHGNLFLPALSGVAVAVDFYPDPPARRHDGSVTVAPGLGSAVVDGISCIRTSLGESTRLTASGLEKEDDLDVVALDLNQQVSWMTAWREQNNIVRVPLKDMRFWGALRTVDKDSPASQGIKVQDVHGSLDVTVESDAMENDPVIQSETKFRDVSVRQLLKGDVIPLREIISFLLKLGTAGLASPVEIEFALSLSQRANEPHEVTILQVRPMSSLITDNRIQINFNHLPGNDATVVSSRRALGHGFFHDLCDVVYIPPSLFSRDSTEQIADEIGHLNQALAAKGRKYILIGPGRWGTHDPRNGIPVKWSQIDSAQFLVETDIKGARVPPSQGAHFFQNMMSFGIGYLTVDLSNPEPGENVDFSWLEELPQQSIVPGLQRVRHVQLAEELEVVVDGISQCGVIMKPGKKYATYVAQFDAVYSNIESEIQLDHLNLDDE